MEERILDVVSGKNHPQVKELSGILNLLGDYEVEFFTNGATAKNFVMKMTKDRAGYRINNSRVVTLCGKAEYRPYFKILSDFAIFLVSSTYVDSANRECINDKKIIVYEKNKRGTELGVAGYASLYS